MKIKMLASLAGPDVSLSVGDEVEWDDAEAGRFIEAGIAIPVAPAPVKETRKSKTSGSEE